VVDAAAHTQAVAAVIVSFAALGAVVGDRAVRDADSRAAGDINASAETVAAVVAIAAGGRLWSSVLVPMPAELPNKTERPPPRPLPPLPPEPPAPPTA